MTTVDAQGIPGLHRISVGPPQRFPALDGYRALAALAVVTTHVGFQTGHTINGSLGGAVARLEIGVSLFFVLSGFLLYLPHARAGVAGFVAPTTRDYLWRRALRIFPAYWVTVVAALLLVRGNEVARTDPTVWLSNLTLLQVYTDQPFVAGLTQMWSLCAEVAFYVALPLMADLATRRHRGDVPASTRRQLTVMAVLVSVAWAWQLWSRSEAWPLPTDGTLWMPAYLDWFAAGMALAVVHSYLHLQPRDSWGSWARTIRDVSALPWTCWIAAAGLYLVLVTPVAGPRDLETSSTGEALTRHILYGVVAVLVMLPGLLETSGGPTRLLASRPLRWLGTISYGVFLYHLIVLDLVFVAQDRAFFSGGFWQVLGPTVGISIVVAAISWYLLESRALRLKSWGPGRRRSRHALDSAHPGPHSPPAQQD